MGSGKRLMKSVAVAAVIVIVAVHYDQKYERDEMHKGAIRDKERQKAKKLQLAQSKTPE